jgi:hypothetical protein
VAIAAFVAGEQAARSRDAGQLERQDREILALRDAVLSLRRELLAARSLRAAAPGADDAFAGVIDAPPVASANLREDLAGARAGSGAIVAPAAGSAVSEVGAVLQALAPDQARNARLLATRALLATRREDIALYALETLLDLEQGITSLEKVIERTKRTPDLAETATEALALLEGVEGPRVDAALLALANDDRYVVRLQSARTSWLWKAFHNQEAYVACLDDADRRYREAIAQIEAGRAQLDQSMRFGRTAVQLGCAADMASEATFVGRTAAVSRSGARAVGRSQIVVGVLEATGNAHVDPCQEMQRMRDFYTTRDADREATIQASRDSLAVNKMQCEERYVGGYFD